MCNICKRGADWVRATARMALLSFYVSIALSSCSTNSPQHIPLEWQTAVHSSSDKYTVQAGDELDIKLYYHPELNESVLVRPDGKISLQLVSETKVLGLTPDEIREKLRRKYAPQIRQSEIAVIVRSFALQKVFIDGEVTRPGSVDLAGKLTVLQAISLAGGFRDTARANEVLLIRRTDAGSTESIVLNMENVINGSSAESDIFLHPLDVVYVPRSPISNVNQWIDKYIRKNLPVPFAFTAAP